MPIKVLILLILGFALVHCSDDEDDTVTAAGGGRCYVSSGSTRMVCLEFINNYDANDGSDLCEAEEDRYRDSHGATGRNFATGNSNDCDENGMVGLCEMSYGDIYYSNDTFNDTTAEDDCTNVQEGTWNDL